MTWDAYNRRKEVLHEVLAIGDNRRGDVTATELLAEAGGVDHDFTVEVNLLLDAQMVWAQALSAQMDRTAFLGDGTLESGAIDAWQAVAAENLTLRQLLDHAVDLPDLQKAFEKEHIFLARAVGVPVNHPDLDGQGKRIKQAAFAAMVYPSADQDAPAGIFDRIREVLAA